MDFENDIRWKQRFRNYKKALARLKQGIDLAGERDLTELEKQGLIQGFEFTHELYWKTIKDFFVEQGNSSIYGSKDATREAFSQGLLEKGEVWMEMIESRNLSSHTYNLDIAESIVEKILNSYFDLFMDFEIKMESLS